MCDLLTRTALQSPRAESLSTVGNQHWELLLVVHNQLTFVNNQPRLLRMQREEGFAQWHFEPKQVQEICPVNF